MIDQDNGQTDLLAIQQHEMQIWKPCLSGAERANIEIISDLLYKTYFLSEYIRHYENIMRPDLQGDLNPVLSRSWVCG